MSRTRAHTPYHVHARRDPNASIRHNGCHLDPSGEGRIVGTREVDVYEEPAWRPRTVEVLLPGSWWPVELVYDPSEMRYLRRDTRQRVILRGGDPLTSNGTDDVFGALIRTERVLVREVVDCDANDPSSNRSCRYISDRADVAAYGYRHRCVFPPRNRRLLWYKPERQEERSFCRAAALDYNNNGEVEVAEPRAAAVPSGLWHGGWPD